MIPFPGPTLSVNDLPWEVGTLLSFADLVRPSNYGFCWVPGTPVGCPGNVEWKESGLWKQALPLIDCVNLEHISSSLTKR